MTRLTPADVAEQKVRLHALDARLAQVAGADLKHLMLAASGNSVVDRFATVKAAAVPDTSGDGVITGFSEAVAATLAHLGCRARVTLDGNVRGLHEAVGSGAELVFVADDDCFVALNVKNARSVDNDSATAWGYATILEAAAGGLEDRCVLVIGLGPVGRAAVAHLLARGALVSVVEPDVARLHGVLEAHPAVPAVSLPEGLARCDLIFDATPASSFIPTALVRPSMIAAVPGLPSGFAPEAQAVLGPRHIHDPLAIGVAAMAALALA